MKMPKLAMLIVATVLVTSHARAQVTVEVAKITCHQFLALNERGIDRPASLRCLIKF
jgi:hypothetical protein